MIFQPQYENQTFSYTLATINLLMNKIIRDKTMSNGQSSDQIAFDTLAPYLTVSPKAPAIIGPEFYSLFLLIRGLIIKSYLFPWFHSLLDHYRGKYHNKTQNNPNYV